MILHRYLSKSSGLSCAIAPALLVAIGYLSPSIVSAQESCSAPLFVCETDRPGKFAMICATEVEPGQQWEAIQYRFGKQDQPPELAYPTDPDKGAESLFFSHTIAGSDYRVSIRFTSGGYRYQVFSDSGKQQAGVRVSDARGVLRSTMRCIERPHMFPAYLQKALACDTTSPYGSAACKESPLKLKNGR